MNWGNDPDPLDAAVVVVNFDDKVDNETDSDCSKNGTSVSGDLELTKMKQAKAILGVIGFRLHGQRSWRS